MDTPAIEELRFTRFRYLSFVADVWSLKTSRCLDAMGAVGSGDVKNMHITFNQLKPCTHGVMVDDKQLSQSILKRPWLK